MISRDRRDAEIRGRRAEWTAKWWLQLKGYSVLATRFKSPVGEIDIIAKRKQTLVFVEVKQRRTLELAQTAVPVRTWKRILRSAEIWTASQPRLQSYDWRFDLIAFGSSRWPKHFRDYWRP